MKLFIICLLLLFCDCTAFAETDVKSESGEITTRTAAASSRKEACERAQSMASNDGQAHGQCDCEKKGGLTLCRVQSTGLKVRSAENKGNDQTVIPAPPKAESGETTTFTTTAAAPSSEEACARAQSLANKEGGQMLSKCACEIRGKMNICRVQYTGLNSESIIGKARKWAREKRGCNKDKEACKPRPIAIDLRG